LAEYYLILNSTEQPGFIWLFFPYGNRNAVNRSIDILLSKTFR